MTEPRSRLPGPPQGPWKAKMSFFSAQIDPPQRHEPLLFWEPEFLSLLLGSKVLSVHTNRNLLRILHFQAPDCANQVLTKNNIRVGEGLTLRLQRLAYRAEFQSVTDPDVCILVEQADALDLKLSSLICPTSAEFLFDGGLGKCLYNSVGEYARHEFTSLRQEGVQVGQAFVTGSGSLLNRGIQIIIHLVIPPFIRSHGQKVNFEAMQSAICNSFKQADQNQVKSVGLTVMGTGGFQWPDELAISALIGSIVQWIAEVNQHTKLRCIHVFDLDIGKVRKVVEMIQNGSSGLVTLLKISDPVRDENS
jgi:O-acetyl-ADP-ribose deacetylase (regulator of RNase III)